jgi:sugar/nucleoside kinase (ribokinase family)
VLLEPSAGLSATGATPLRAVLGCALEARQVDDWVRAASSLRPHLVILNLAEARAIAGNSADHAALSGQIAERFGAAAVVTHDRGAAGSLGGSTISVDAQPTSAVDTTGAGDAFAAALVAELATVPWPPSAATFEDAMRHGVDLAGAVAGVEGAQARVAGERLGQDR